jgi:hypothetical protein
MGKPILEIIKMLLDKQNRSIYSNCGWTIEYFIYKLVNFIIGLMLFYFVDRIIANESYDNGYAFIYDRMINDVRNNTVFISVSWKITLFWPFEIDKWELPNK